MSKKTKDQPVEEVKTVQERLAYVEGRVESEKSQEVLYMERRTKYDKNIAAKRVKESKAKAFMDELESED